MKLMFENFESYLKISTKVFTLPKKFFFFSHTERLIKENSWVVSTDGTHDFNPSKMTHTFNISLNLVASNW